MAGRYIQYNTDGSVTEGDLGLVIPICRYCKMPENGPHIFADCPGDTIGMQRRIADLERRIEALESAANTRRDDGPSS
jgi:hypothetical protein